MKTLILGFILLFTLQVRAQTDTTTHSDTTIPSGDTTLHSDSTSLADTTVHADTLINSDTTIAINYYLVTDINGEAHSIQDYGGEKVWLVILPSSQSFGDSAFLIRIDSVAVANRGKVKTIAVPSFEDGYMGDSSHTLISWYASHLDSSVLISQPLHTHLTSGTSQANLFQWLTHSSLNNHYDMEVSGVGAMFFIDEQGNLTGVFDNDSMWSNKALNMMLD